MSVGSFIYPVVPAMAATQLQAAGHEVSWDDGADEGSRTELHLRRTDYMRGSTADEEALRKVGIDPGMVRLSVGLEDVDDLWRDLSRALIGSHARRERSSVCA